MADALPRYTALPGRARRRMGILDGTRGRLYLAEDHLLLLQMTTYMEEPRLIYLKDIRALSIAPNAGHLIATAALLALGLLLWAPYAIIALFLPEALETVGFGFALLGGIGSALPGLLIMLNLALGPRCRFHIHTAASTVELFGQGRLRTARRVRDLLVPHIRAAQANPANLAETGQS